jgi:hypothetical protein
LQLLDKVCPVRSVKAIVLPIHEGGTQDQFPFGTFSPRISDITRALDPEVDLVMAGHSHTALNSRVDGRLVVQASSFGRAFEDVRITLDRRTNDIARSRPSCCRPGPTTRPTSPTRATRWPATQGSRRSSTTP